MPEFSTRPSFSLHGEFEGRPITPDNIDILSLNQFLGEVVDLLQGELDRGDLGRPAITIETGSLKIIPFVSTVVAGSLAADLTRFQGDLDLDGLSPKRAKVLQKWRSRSNATQFYSVAFGEGNSEALTINSETIFKHRQKDQWTKTEKYLRGRVVDLGGKNVANIHMVVPGVPGVVVVDASEDELRGADYLYKEVTLGVRGLEHIRTGELKDLRLLEVHPTPEEIDEEKLQELWNTGKEAWSDVKDSSAWVEELRS